MALDKNSSAFTFGFAIIMVVVVGAALSFTAMSLKPMQDQNAADKKRMDILGAIKVEATRANAQEVYSTYIKSSLVLNHKGEVKEGAEAFDVDIQKEFRDKTLTEEDRNYPLFLAEKDGKEYLVVPVVGKGLWGPIWGFCGLESDYTTFYGASFDHKSETPGLGAEIKTDMFEGQFPGKTLNYDGNKLFEVTKGAGSSSTNFQVDGITGGTITSKGVEEMLVRTFNIYKNYFESKKSVAALPAVQEVVETLTEEVEEVVTEEETSDNH